MACIRNQSSSSSHTKNFDVFVSFRGADTRNNFTGHLFAALERKSIDAFKDDQKIKKGEFLEPELLQAIEGSRVFIVVFSKDYASSTWCMKELQKIVDWVEKTGRSVLPVFYDVTPSEVRKQSGKFGEAFAKHEERFKDDLEMVQKWREALNAITNRCGWDVQNKPQHEEIEKIVGEEAKNLEAILIEQHPLELQETTLPTNALSKMNHLKLVILENINFSGSLDYLSNELRYVYWKKYPSRCLPSSFYPDKLVELFLPYSNIKQLWEGTKYLPNLIRLDLNNSKNLTEMPDLRGAPRLKYLDLSGCIEIVRIDPSIGILRELVSLSLRNCKKLFINLNIIFGLNSLKGLDLAGCSKLLNNRLPKKPKETEHLEKVETNRSVIQLSTSSIYEILMSPFNFLSNRKNKDSLGLLVPYLSRFPCLLGLDLSFCNLLQIPDAIGNLHSLKTLNMGGNKFVRLPTTIKELSNLDHLNLEHCKQLKYLPELPTIKEQERGKYVRELFIFNCPNLSEMEHCYHIAFSWMTQIFKALLESSLSLVNIEIIIPGTQIPWWFNKQNVGNSISMDLSVVMEDPNWIAISCCAMLVACHDDSADLNDRWQLDYVTTGYSFQNNQVLGNTYWAISIAVNDDLIMGEIDHLFILFLSRESLIHHLDPYEDEMIDLDKIGFTIGIFNLPKDLHFEVKNCGYRCVFKKDLEQLNLNTMFGGNFSSMQAFNK
ncbi:TMV resistance protein N isoform X3 [Cajanus cajan]|uniref:TMV resistance protein N isoform X3 n=1 Tax=Cajanus cajan TaxID=3821 RepID=UPI0010FAFBDF|nr:TMV resistance protein N isoform X3 [Cajanus cajan]